MFVGSDQGNLRKGGTEVAIPKIRERAKESFNDYEEDGREVVGSCEPLTVTVETITRRDMICKGKKTTRKEERTTHETERQTTAVWLGLSSISRARVESTRKTKEKRWGYCLPLTRPGVGGFIGKVGDKDKFPTSWTKSRKVTESLWRM